MIKKVSLLNKRNKLFALDIGTRSCVGIILEEQDPEKYDVTDLLTIGTCRAFHAGWTNS